MKKLLFLFLILLSLSFAQFGGDPQKFEDRFRETTDHIWNTGTGFAYSVLGSFTPTSCDADQSWLNFGKMNWVIPSAFVVILVVIGITFVYMAGNLFQLPNLIVLAKEELFHAFSTVILISLVIGALAAANSGFYQFQTAPLNPANPTPDPIYSTSSGYMIDAAMVFSLRMVQEMNTVFSHLLLFNMVIHTLYTSTLYFGVTWRAMYSFNLGPALKPLIDILGLSMQLLSVAVGEWVLHLVTLCIIKKWTFPLFIPVGILLRAFPQTRAGGGALFSLVFMLALIYPFMFLVNYEVHKIMRGTILDTASQASGSTLSTFVNDSGIFQVGVMVVSFLFLTAGALMPLLIESAITIAFEIIRASVYYVIMFGIFLPFVNIFITLTAAKEAAKLWSDTTINYFAFIKLI